MHLGDRELLDRCAGGDRFAWGRLVEQHDRRIAAVLARALGPGGRSELADLRQDVYARLLARGGTALRGLRADRPGAVAAFVSQVARRVALDHARARSARPAAGPLGDQASELPARELSPEQHAQERQARDRVAWAMERACAGRHRARDLQILRAHVDDALGPAEIARLGCGLSAKGVEALLRRLRARVEALLREAGSLAPPGGSP